MREGQKPQDEGNTYQLKQEGQDKGVFFGNLRKDGKRGVSYQSSCDAVQSFSVDGKS